MYIKRNQWPIIVSKFGLNHRQPNPMRHKPDELPRNNDRRLFLLTEKIRDKIKQRKINEIAKRLFKSILFKVYKKMGDLWEKSLVPNDQITKPLLKIWVY